MATDTQNTLHIWPSDEVWRDTMWSGTQLEGDKAALDAYAAYLGAALPAHVQISLYKTHVDDSFTIADRPPEYEDSRPITISLGIREVAEAEINAKISAQTTPRPFSK
jgi:hypothetical protein